MLLAGSMQQPPEGPPYLPSEPGAAPRGTPRATVSAGATACLVVVGVTTIGLVVAVVLAVIAFRRFNAAAKGAEARSTVATIARAQAEAFAANGTLCGPASPVPAKVPTGSRYQPSLLPGDDFQKGSATDGWPCLKIAMTTPIGFQYEMRVRGAYKGVARGGPDPGPDGFEVSAEGDLDGNGKTSLFVQVGHIDPTTGTVVLVFPLFAVDETE